MTVASAVPSTATLASNAVQTSAASTDDSDDDDDEDDDDEDDSQLPWCDE